eukprot:gene31915-biopygen5719
MSAEITKFVDNTFLKQVLLQKDIKLKNLSRTAVNDLKVICNAIISMTSVPACMAESVCAMQIAYAEFIAKYPKGKKHLIEAMLLPVVAAVAATEASDPAASAAPAPAPSSLFALASALALPEDDGPTEDVCLSEESSGGTKRPRTTVSLSRPKVSKADPMVSKADPMAWSIGMLMSKVKNGLYGTQANKMILMGILIIIITTLLLIYIARRITRKDLISQEILKKPFKLYAGGSLSKPFVYSSTKIPSSKNGIEFTYSFWLCTSSFDITSLPKLIFTRGFDMSYGGASPIVYMDAKTNSLHFSVRTNVSNTNATLGAVRDHKSQFLIATVEYVPLQRWVQFALIVKDNIMTILMDGELYTIENVLDMQT